MKDFMERKMTGCLHTVDEKLSMEEIEIVVDWIRSKPAE